MRNVRKNSFSRRDDRKDEVEELCCILRDQKRIKEAIQLMKKTDMQIQMIAEKVGINDLSYFSKLFKKYYGISPSAFR